MLFYNCFEGCGVGFDDDYAGDAGELGEVGRVGGGVEALAIEGVDLERLASWRMDKEGARMAVGADCVGGRRVETYGADLRDRDAIEDIVAIETVEVDKSFDDAIVVENRVASVQRWLIVHAIGVVGAVVDVVVVAKAGEILERLDCATNVVQLDDADTVGESVLKHGFERGFDYVERVARTDDLGHYVGRDL